MQVFNNNNNKFVLLLRKCVYLYEYMDEKKNAKENFYSHLNMEHITNANYTHSKRIF